MKSAFQNILIVFLITAPWFAHAKTVRYELTVRNEKLNLSGQKEVDFALTVNGGIPAPVLEFTEGDDAEILVKNEVPNEEVSIHWHGILLPPEEDGVAYVNTPPIHPGQSRLFRFPIRQNGTYWYHSHTTVQEQKGVYGAFIIHPRKKAIAYDRDAVVVLSDWSDENADQIIRNLRKDGDYYLYKKDSVRSYFGALRAGSLGTHLSNEWTRMGGMDLSDVGYDAFLINGKRDSQLINAKPGERVRLRIINAGASSYFYVSMGLPMQIIAADGVDVTPVMAKEILLGMAETYDVLFTMPEPKSYELRATVQDVTGFASTWIGSGEKVFAPTKEKPNAYASMEHGAHEEHKSHGAHAAVNGDHAAHAHHAHAAATKTDWSNQSDAMLKQNRAGRTLAGGQPVDTLTVDALRAIESTALPKDARVHDLALVLDGDMERYIWHMNGKAIHEDRLIEIQSGEIVRIKFKNETMMHHPMHLHGHFFRVVNGGANGREDRSPLKHTVDVPPHGERIIEFYANEPGQWMLHCHNLYHMKTGMARVIRYKDFQLTPSMRKYDQHDPHLHEHIYNHTRLEGGTNHARAEARLIRTWDEIGLDLETKNEDAGNFEVGREWDLEGDLFYRRWFDNYLHVFGGGSLFHEKGFGVLGVGYVLPMLIEAQVSVNHEGRFRFDIEKRFQWTSTVFTDAEMSWRPGWEAERETEFELSLMYGPSWRWAAGLMATENSLGVDALIQF